MWILRCARHGTCIGFHICKQRESINDPIHVLYSRFSKSPEFCSGDFNCMVQRTAMVKDYRFFKNSVFYSDEFHHKSHTRCSEAFNARSFKNIYNKTMLYLNDSIPEQRNRIINKFKISLMYSSIETFMIMCKLMLILDNRQLQRRLDGLNSFLNNKKH